MEIFPVVKNLRSQMLGPGRGSLLRGAKNVLSRPVRTLRSFKGVTVSKALDEAMQQSQYRVLVNLQHEESRGQLRLADNDPTVPPVLDYHYFSHPLDRKYEREGIRIALEMLHSRSMRHLVEKVTSPLSDDVVTDAALDDWLARRMGTAFHMAGTCKMGAATDPDAVVDQTGRVHGLDGVRVVDTSIMPKVVRRGPNATAIMMGERAVEFFD
jgi:choline dehydrogenase-like flavoprotein